MVVDHPLSAQALSSAAQDSGKPIQVLVDVDPGMGRSGVQPGAATLEFGLAVQALPGLILVGAQCYDGDVQHVGDLRQRRARSLAAMTMLTQTRDIFRAAGLSTQVLSGGGTGTHVAH